MIVNYINPGKTISNNINNKNPQNNGWYVTYARLWYNIQPKKMVAHKY